MPQFNDIELTAAVISSFEEVQNPRVKFLMEELDQVVARIRPQNRSHLSVNGNMRSISSPASARSARPSRQEFILLSDVLGVSMLVDAVNHGNAKARPRPPCSARSMSASTSRCRMAPTSLPIFRAKRCSCRAVSPTSKGKPLANVPVDIWHADDDGWYDSQKPDYETTGPSSRGRFVTDAEGGSTSAPFCRAAIRSRPTVRSVR